MYISDNLMCQSVLKFVEMELMENQCARIVQVYVYPNNQPEKAVRTYCIIDDQSKRSLAKSEIFDAFGEQGPEVQYNVSLCSGICLTTGRRASNYPAESLDGSTTLRVLTLTDCNQIPNNRDEIPTPEVTKYYSHLQDITTFIPPVNNDAPILLLLGRDIISVHHVHDQRIGHDNSPYGQKLNLG
jgi:hypothetical protein